MTDLSDILNSYGIPEMKSRYIENRINGSDLLNLINDLKNGSEESINDANIILKNFGVNIHSPTLNKNNQTQENKDFKMSYNKRLMELAGINVPDDQIDVDANNVDVDSDIVTDIPDDDVSVVTDTTDVVPVECSPEMSQINDFINNIISLAPDVRVSEAKPLKIRIKELCDYICNLDQSYMD